MQASALYGLRMELPPLGSVAGVAYVIAFFGWSYATVQLVADKGGMRLVGYGLGLLALGGYDAGSPVELTLSLLGLCAVAVGELRAAPYADRSRPRVTPADWRAFVGRLATALGDGTEPDGTPPQAVIAEEEELEVSRIQTHRRGYPVVVKLLRRRGTLVELDATVGPVGPRAARRQHRTPPPLAGAQPRAPAQARAHEDGRRRVRSEVQRARRGAAGDAELRHRIARQQGDGVLTLWTGSAARYLLDAPVVDRRGAAGVRRSGRPAPRPSTAWSRSSTRWPIWSRPRSRPRAERAARLRRRRLGRRGRRQIGRPLRRRRRAPGSRARESARAPPARRRPPGEASRYFL